MKLIAAFAILLSIANAAKLDFSYSVNISSPTFSNTGQNQQQESPPNTSNVTSSTPTSTQTTTPTTITTTPTTITTTPTTVTTTSASTTTSTPSPRYITQDQFYQMLQNMDYSKPQPIVIPSLNESLQAYPVDMNQVSGSNSGSLSGFQVLLNESQVVHVIPVNIVSKTVYLVQNNSNGEIIGTLNDLDSEYATVKDFDNNYIGYVHMIQGTYLVPDVVNYTSGTFTPSNGDSYSLTAIIPNGNGTVRFLDGNGNVVQNSSLTGSYQIGDNVVQLTNGNTSNGDLKQQLQQ